MDYDAVLNDTSIVNHIQYDAFGNIIAVSNATIPVFYAYTGQEWDPDAGLYYYAARWYDPATGKFLSEDPIGFGAGDTNLGRYVGNSPTNFVDPTGLKEERLGFIEVTVQSSVSETIRGGTFSVGVLLSRTGQLRLDYVELAAKLNALDITAAEKSAMREALKEEFRKKQTELGKAITKRILESREATGHKSSMQSPGKTNVGVNRRAVVMRRCGRALIGITVTLEVVNIVNTPPDERGEELARAGGRLGGALAGGKVGGMAGAPGGPLGVGVGAFVGGGLGAFLGEATVNSFIDPADPYDNYPRINGVPIKDGQIHPRHVHETEAAGRSRAALEGSYYGGGAHPGPQY